VSVARIYRYGATCLRRRAVAAPVDAPETRALLDTLWETLAADGGVGLAAPQIGHNRRVIVIRDPERPAGRQRLDLVNPVIRCTFGAAESFEEGCLSFPDLYTTITRPAGVEVEYADPARPGQSLQLRNEHLLARIIQHEVDHLDGVLFIDHLSRRARWLLGPKLLWIMWRRLFGG